VIVASRLGSFSQPASSEQSARVLRILEEYMAVLERGGRPDPEGLLARHPDLADVLAARERIAREELVRAEREREELKRIGVARSARHDVDALLAMILAKMG